MLQDPLTVNIALKGVKTELPLLPEKEYRFQVVESTIDPNKDTTGLNWNLVLQTPAPETAVDNRDIPPGHKVFLTAALQAREDSKDREAFRRGLGQIMDALDGTNEDNRADFTQVYASSCAGKFLRATAVIDTYQGRQNNKLKNLKKD